MTSPQLPAQVASKAYVSPGAGEFAWKRDDLPEALRALVESGHAILGGEVWVVETLTGTWSGLVPSAFIERFNKTYRDEVLDAYVFETIDQVRTITEDWLREYNEERPHDSLGRVPPLTFMPRRATAGKSTLELCP